MSFQPNVSRYHTETAVLLGTGPKQSSAGHFTAAATALYRVNAPQEQLRSAISLSVILCITQCINETADGQTYCQLHFYSYTVHSDITVSYIFTVTLYIQTSLSVTLLQLHCTFRHHCQLHFYSYIVHSDITVSYTFTVTLYIQTSLSVTVSYSMHHRNS